MALRNAFAHHKTSSHLVLVVGKTDKEDNVHLELLVISNSGKITRKHREAALAEFKTSYAVAKESLISLLATIKATDESNAV